MAKKKNELEVAAKKVKKPLLGLNTAFYDMVDNMSSGFGSKRDRELERLTDEIDDVIFQEIKSLTEFTGEDISTFIVKLFNDFDRESGQQNEIKSIEDIFGGENNGIQAAMQERHRNKNLLYEDLSVVCGQLNELREAVLATRDAMVTADDLTQNVSRTLKINNANEENADKQSYISAIQNMEKRFGLLEKLRDHIIPNTLQFGKYYVYTVPYETIFQQHVEKQGKKQATAALESVDSNFAKAFKNELQLDTTVKDSEIKDSFNHILEHVSIMNDETMTIPIFEGTDLDGLMDEKFKKQAQSASTPKNTTPFADGTADIKKTKDMDFSNIKDCYIKLIDPRKIIPIKILDQTVGYYYIHQEEVKTTRSPFTTTIKASNVTNAKELETTFLTKVTDKIVKGFNKSFLEKNAKFKEMIVNSLIYNDVYKKQLRFQFIPVDHITEFAINRNEEGEGTSMIYPSLFYAKLYLALLIFKMITIISKSNDTKVYYVKQSGLDQNVANKIQEIARTVKERQINFQDLLNYGAMISKIGQAKDIFMPVGRSGEKGIDFDILAGQDVQMNTELMEFLRTNFINASGVPSVIMNYVNEADYAKTLVMANAKFLGRVVNFQLDTNSAATELYRKILTYTSQIPKEILAEFEFSLSTPKALVNTNTTDIISNADQQISFMIKVMTGENSNQTEQDNRRKDILYRRFAQELLPMFPWNLAEKIFEEVEVELRQEEINRKADGSADAQ